MHWVTKYTYKNSFFRNPFPSGYDIILLTVIWKLPGTVAASAILKSYPPFYWDELYILRQICSDPGSNTFVLPLEYSLEPGIKPTSCMRNSHTSTSDLWGTCCQPTSSTFRSVGDSPFKFIKGTISRNSTSSSFTFKHNFSSLQWKKSFHIYCDAMPLLIWNAHVKWLVLKMLFCCR